VSILLGHVLNGKGDGTFVAPKTYSVGFKPTAIASADFNADGRPDLVITNQNDNSFLSSCKIQTAPSPLKLTPPRAKIPQ